MGGDIVTDNQRNTGEEMRLRMMYLECIVQVNILEKYIRNLWVCYFCNNKDWHELELVK